MKLSTNTAKLLTQIHRLLINRDVYLLQHIKLTLNEEIPNKIQEVIKDKVSLMTLTLVPSSRDDTWLTNRAAAVMAYYSEALSETISIPPSRLLLLARPFKANDVVYLLWAETCNTLLPGRVTQNKSFTFSRKRINKVL